MSLDFVALDFETANPRHASVIQIGVSMVLNGRVKHTSSAFVMPPPGFREFAYHNTKVHGIREADIVGADDWPATLERLQRFLTKGAELARRQSLPIVAHNAGTERSVITKASAVHGIRVPAFNYFCTLRLARAEFPDEPSKSLGTLSSSLGLPGFEHHDAGADAEAAAQLLLHVAERRGVNELEQMAHGFMR